MQGVLYLCPIRRRRPSLISHIYRKANGTCPSIHAIESFSTCVSCGNWNRCEKRKYARLSGEAGGGRARDDLSLGARGLRKEWTKTGEKIVCKQEEQGLN